MKAGLAFALVSVVRAQPLDEAERLLVAPHPGWKACERCELERRASRATEHVIVDARCIRPIGLDRNEVEAASPDQLTADMRPHAVELATAVASLAE